MFLKNFQTIGDAVATKAFQEVRGREWRISPVVIWEILQTSNDSIKEDIIYFCQHLFHNKLLPSPDEIIIHYIKNGMPNIENGRELFSNSSLAQAWQDICKIKHKTLIYDKARLKERFSLLKPFSKMLHKLLRNEDVILSSYGKFIGWDITFNDMVNNLSFTKHGKNITKEERTLYKISIFYIIILLCTGVGLDNYIIDNFWREIGIDDIKARILFSLRNFETLIHRGPIVLMAFMTLYQCDKKFSRGVFFDSLHSVYLPYVDMFLTNDKDFCGLRNLIEFYPNSLKIHNISELKFLKENRENPSPD